MILEEWRHYESAAAKSPEVILRYRPRPSNTTQTFAERILGIGTVHVGTGGLEVVLASIPGTHKVEELISKPRCFTEYFSPYKKPPMLGTSQ